MDETNLEESNFDEMFCSKIYTIDLFELEKENHILLVTIPQ